MIFVENIDQEGWEMLPTDSHSKRTQSWNDFSSIQQFLDAQVWEKKNQSPQNNQNNSQICKSQTPTKDENSSGNRETQAHSTQKSIFHNFQKNLITLLRKVITMTLHFPTPNFTQSLALTLWNTFKKVSSYNKQTLHIIFGVSNFNNFETQLQKLAAKYREFRPVRNRYSPDQIFEAQGYIRKQVVEQLRKLDKPGLRACSNVRQFETFYSYLQSFLLELEQGPISSRMSKTRKLVVLQKITHNPHTNDL